MDESPGSFELLSSRVDALELRVHHLEHPEEATAPAAKLIAIPANTAADEEAASLQTENIFLLLGRAMLGIAGAYVLRAIAEAGVMPNIVVAALAVAYACAWLLWAVRGSKAAGLAPLVYAGTSAVILVPMLWEETLHFHAFAPYVTAAILATFTGAASAFIWRRESSQVLWLTYGAASATAAALSVAAHAMLPFVIVLLLIVLLIESARIRGHARPMWPLVALVADALIWGMIFIYSGPESARADFPELSVAVLVFPALLLFAINATSVTVRAIFEGKRIGIFEIAQAMVAFGLAILGLLSFAPEAATSLGITCLILSAAGYLASLRLLRSHADRRNITTFSTWSAALLVAGALWSLPHAGAGAFLAVAGLAAYAVAPRIASTTLEWHGAAFLCTSAAVSGLALYIFQVLVSSLPVRPGLAVLVAAGAAIAAYVVCNDAKDDKLAYQFLRLVPALLAVAAVSALLVHGVVAFATLAVAPNPHHIALLRTLVVSVISLCLAYSGPRLGRIAMTRMAYVALAFIAAKLLFEDLRHGHMEFIAASIFLFAVTLIAVPRLMRMGTKSRAESHARKLLPIRN
ncbi:MAG: hypothetical protein WBQ95_19055 [Terracidiphilus sp.]